jgi:copper transport protein
MATAIRALVLAATAGFATLAAAASPLAIHIHSGQAMFQVLVSPGTVGSDSVVLQLMSGDGNLLEVRQASIVLSLPGGGIGPTEFKAVLGADGYWHLADVPIPQAGRWHVRISAVTDFRTITLEDDFEVPPP